MAGRLGPVNVPTLRFSFLFLGTKWSFFYCSVLCEMFIPSPPSASHCSLLDSFDTVPGHLTEDLHLYSLNDLTATKKGELGPRLAELTQAGAAHVERCMVRPCHGVQSGLGLGLGSGWSQVLGALLRTLTGPASTAGETAKACHSEGSEPLSHPQ